MRFAAFATAIRKRASLLPTEESDPEFEKALHALVKRARYGLDDEALAIRRTLCGVLGFAGAEPYEASELEYFTDETLRRLDVLIEAVMDGTWNDKLLRDALRPGLLRPVK